MFVLIWYMENEITSPSGEKNWAPSWRLRFFKSRNNRVHVQWQPVTGAAPATAGPACALPRTPPAAPRQGSARTAEQAGLPLDSPWTSWCLPTQAEKNSRRALQRLLVKVTAEEKEEGKGTVPAAPVLAPPWNEGKLGAGPSPESCRHGNRATPQAGHRPPVTRAGHRRWACWSQISRWASPRAPCACEALLLGMARWLFIDPTNSKLGLGLQPRRATALANSSRKEAVGCQGRAVRVQAGAEPRALGAGPVLARPCSASHGPRVVLSRWAAGQCRCLDSEAGPGPPCGQWEGSPEPDTECGHCRRCLPSPGGRDHFKNTSTKSCFFNSCVTLDKLLNFSGPQVSHLKSRDDSRDCLWAQISTHVE